MIFRAGFKIRIILRKATQFAGFSGSLSFGSYCMRKYIVVYRIKFDETKTCPNNSAKNCTQNSADVRSTSCHMASFDRPSCQATLAASLDVFVRNITKTLHMFLFPRVRKVHIIFDPKKSVVTSKMLIKICQVQIKICPLRDKYSWTSFYLGK